VTDKRQVLLEAAMRRHGFAASGLIESLHTAQQTYGFLDSDVLRFVARGLKAPPSKVFGVATFYNIFTLKPPGAHTCVVCTGTACYIKGAPKLLAAVEGALRLKPGMTTADKAVSLVQARCCGSCALAPVITLDGTLVGGTTVETMLARLRAWTSAPPAAGEAHPHES
jgi:bidirectional [NiFe] hydrogenase diaphorase subunit